MKNTHFLLHCARNIICCSISVLAVLIMLGCTQFQDQPEVVPGPSPEELAAQHNQQMSDLENRIYAAVPSVYLTVSPSDASSIEEGVSHTDSSFSSGNPTGSRDYSGLTAADLFRPVIVAMLNENYDICLALAGDEKAASVEAEYSALLAELDSCKEIEALYTLFGQMDSRIFSAAAIDPSTESKQFSVELYGYTDSEGDMWACAYTNTALPGFEDAQSGFSLTVLLNNGKAAAAAADSIHSHSAIEYINEYSVRFRLRDILGEQATVDDLLNGSSRVIFSLYSLDNSFTCSKEHYKWRVERTLETDPLAARHALASVIQDYYQNS